MMTALRNMTTELCFVTRQTHFRDSIFSNMLRKGGVSNEAFTVSCSMNRKISDQSFGLPPFLEQGPVLTSSERMFKGDRLYREEPQFQSDGPQFMSKKGN